MPQTSVLKFYIWIPRRKIFEVFFFSCPSYLPFWSYAPLNKIRMKSDACHILWTVHARVLKFHIWIPRGKIADPYFFLIRVTSFSGVTPLWKNQNEILSARYLEKYMSYGLETWSADRGWWVEYLIKFKKKSPYFSGVMALWKFWYFEKIRMKSFQQDILKIIELGAWNLVSW